MGAPRLRLAAALALGSLTLAAAPALAGDPPGVLTPAGTGVIGPAAVGLTGLRPAPAPLFADLVGTGSGEADPATLTAPRDSTLRLPAHMPPYTTFLWGHRGVVRALGLAPSSRRKELQLRRKMLGLHQTLGLVTWGVFTAQMVTGQLLVNDYSDRTARLHRPLGYTTFGLYLGTATLSLGAPPARRYDTGYSTVRLHRWLALVHFSGMMAQPWLGRWVANASGDYDRRRTIHQAVGYVTYAAFTTAMGTILLGR